MSCGRARTHDHRVGSKTPYPIAPHSDTILLLTQSPDSILQSLDKLSKLLEAAEMLRSDVANFNDSLESMSDRNPIVKTKFNDVKQTAAIDMPKLTDVEIERINTALKKTPKKAKRRKNTKGIPQYTAQPGKRLVCKLSEIS